MNDGFHWFIAAVFVLGLFIGLLLGQALGWAASVLACIAVLVGIFAFYKFIYTPVRGVEDDQE